VAAAGGPTADNTTNALQQEDGSLSLTVTDGSDPVAGAEVTLSRDGEQVLSGTTADDGTLQTGPIADGQYRVTIREAGYYERSLSITVEGETRRSVTLDPGSVELTVTVADERTGDPLSDATVDVDAAGTVRTGTDGTQTVRVPVNSEVGLTVTKSGYERESLTVAVGEAAQSITVGIAREADLSLSLSADTVDAGGSVTATVTDAYGDPVAGASILLDGEVVAETDGDGTASVPVESSGEHSVRARAGGALSESHTVVAEGSSSDPSTATATERPSGDATATGTGDPTETVTPVGTVATATAANDTGSSPFAGLPIPELPLSGSVIPDLGDREGPLGILPPLEGSIRIILVLLGVGAVGLVFSILRTDDL
jgi:hypothetical protein